MIGASHATNHTPKELGRQQFFDELLPLASEVAARAIAKTRRSGGRVGDLDTLAIAELLREEFSKLHERLSALEVKCDEAISQRFQVAVEKEYYSTQEVARLLGKKPYTVREWCRLGRIRGEKANFGRGLDNEWRVSHEELERIRNEGLLCINNSSSVKSPKRLA